jgi:hypothetical protein
MEAAFPMGAQVRYSERGLSTLVPRSPIRVGTVVGYAKGGRNDTVCCVKVQWPLLTSPVILHRDFLELAG